MSEISPGYVLCSMWPHKPKRSATADRKEAPSANRANRRIISVPFSVSCAVFEFIRASGAFVEPERYHLARFDGEEPAFAIVLHDVPRRNYERSEFGIGVD